LIHFYIENILLRLSISPIIQTFEVVKQREGNDEGYIRVKCNLFNSDIFEFSEYLVLEKDLVVVKTYNFHWQKSDGTLITRWDNVEHHPEIKSFPHHVHEGEEKVSESDSMNFDKVISFIEDRLYRIERD